MKTIIFYQTSAGYAISVAKEIGTRLGGKVEYGNLHDKSLPDLSDFNRIIVGVDALPGIQPQEVVRFWEQNRDQLIASEVGLYISCRETGDEARQLFIQSFPEELQSHAKGILINGGVTDFEGKLLNGSDTGLNAATQPEVLKDIDRFVRRIDRVFMPMMLFI